MRTAQADHRRVLLFTSMPKIWAQDLAAGLGVAEVIFIDADTRKSSVENIRMRLIGLFGTQEFDYIGDGRRDLPICKLARRVLIVSSSRSGIARAKENASVESVIPRDRAGPIIFIKMIRIDRRVEELPHLGAAARGAQARLSTRDWHWSHCIRSFQLLCIVSLHTERPAGPGIRSSTRPKAKSADSVRSNSRQSRLADWYADVPHLGLSGLPNWPDSH